MRKLIAMILGTLHADKDPVLLDHIPARAADPVVEKPRVGAQTLLQKIASARARHGKAWKCAAADQDREVLMAVTPDGRDVYRIVKAGMRPTTGCIAESEPRRLRAASG